jgi:hypothetical protein
MTQILIESAERQRTDAEKLPRDANGSVAVDAIVGAARNSGERYRVSAVGSNLKAQQGLEP